MSKILVFQSYHHRYLFREHSKPDARSAAINSARPPIRATYARAVFVVKILILWLCLCSLKNAYAQQQIRIEALFIEDKQSHWLVGTDKLIPRPQAVSQSKKLTSTASLQLLSDVAKNLSDRYRIHGALIWQRNMPTDRHEPWIRVSTGAAQQYFSRAQYTHDDRALRIYPSGPGTPVKVHLLDGYLRIGRGRFFHLNYTMAWNDPTQAASIPIIGNRRMREGELNLLDHGPLSVLIELRVLPR